MSSRLQEGHRTISWTVSRDIVVGYHDCDNCGVETPTPTDAELVEFAKHLALNSRKQK